MAEKLQRTEAVAPTTGGGLPSGKTQARVRGKGNKGLNVEPMSWPMKAAMS